MPTSESISVVIPAFNEEENLAKAIQTVKEIVSSRFSDYELLVYNDASTDRTGAIAEELSCQDARIKVIHHQHNQGLGGCYRSGARIARKAFYLLVHGDNEITPQTIQLIIQKATEAEIVIPYIQNPSARPLSRRVISKAYTLLTNFIFGLRIPYYNGPCLIKTSLVKDLPIESSGFGFMAEALIKLIKLGHSYVIVGFNCRLREKGKTKAFRLKNIFNVIMCVFSLRMKLRSFLSAYSR